MLSRLPRPGEAVGCPVASLGHAGAVLFPIASRGGGARRSAGGRG
jgi:hypothetical protein